MVHAQPLYRALIQALAKRLLDRYARGVIRLAITPAFMLLWLLSLAGLSPLSHAQPLPAALSTQDQWIVTVPDDRDPPRQHLLHRSVGDEPGRLTDLGGLTFTPHRQGLAALQDLLFVIDQEGAVRRVSAVPPMPPAPASYQATQLTRLPEDSEPRALLATEAGLFVLTRVHDLSELPATRPIRQKPAPPTDPGLLIALGLPPGIDLNPQAPNPPTRPVASKLPKPLPEPPADLLLRFDRGRWSVVPTPTPIPSEAQALLLNTPNQALPTVLMAEEDTLTVWHPVPAEQSVHLWRIEQHTAPQGMGLAATRIDRQIILAVADPSARQLTVHLSRLDDLGLQPLTTAGFDLPSDSPWTLQADGPNAAQVLAAPRNAPADPTAARWEHQRIDLLGQAKPMPPLIVHTVSAFERQLDFIILVAVLVIATAVVLVIWPAEVRQDRVRLPDALEFAPLSKRVLAGLIDLTPPVLFVLYVMDTPWETLVEYWPGQGRAPEVEKLLPGLTVIGLYVLHTTVLELLFARSLGKMITKTRLAGYEGLNPSAWRILLRALVKPIDLLGLPLLCIMLFYRRQRFCDLVAKTLVVQPKPPSQEATPPETP